MAGETISNPALGWAGALAGPVLGLFGNLFNAGSQVAENEKNREWQEHMYQVQRQDALADWNMQNEYNSPQKQMERLAAAGLNPNLTYGNGAAVANSTTMPRASQYQSMNFPAPHLNLEALNLSKMFAEIEVLKSQAHKNESDAKNAESQAAYVAQKTQFDTDTAELRKQLLSNENHQVLRTIAKIDNDIMNGTLLANSQINFTNEQIKSMAFARMIQWKQLQLSAEEIGANIRFGIKKLEIEARNATSAATNAAANYLNAQANVANAETNRMRANKLNEFTDKQIGEMALTIADHELEHQYLADELHFEFEGMQLSNEQRKRRAAFEKSFYDEFHCTPQDIIQFIPLAPSVQSTSTPFGKKTTVKMF